MTKADSFIFNDAFIIFLNTFGSISQGLGSGLLWVAQGKFFSECARERSKGFFFGFFWALYMSTQVFGNLFAAFLFKNFSLTSFYLIMLCSCCLSAVIFMMLSKPELE